MQPAPAGRAVLSAPGAARRHAVSSHPGPAQDPAAIEGHGAGAVLAWRSAVLRTTACLALLLSLLPLGCGARVVLEDPLADDDDEHEEPECTADLEPRVEDCERESTDAVPLARLEGDGWHLAADDEFLYYISDGTVYRLAMIGGEPEALTPFGSALSDIQYADGFLYWMDSGVVKRVPKEGGEPEPLVELASTSTWAVAGDAILSSAPTPEPAPLYRTSWITGETSELLALDPEQFIWKIGVGDGHALVARSHGLVSVPLGGGEPQVLAGNGVGAGQPPVVHDGQVYFGSTHPQGDHSGIGLLRVDLDDPAAPELVLDGFPVAFAFADDTLYGHTIPVPEIPGEKVPGRIVRQSLAGGDPEHITDTSAYAEIGFTHSSNGLVVSGCNVYFIDKCNDNPGGHPNQFRVVTVSKVPGGGE